ncbi:hydroxyethylthiazole kinase [Haemophilus influenzae]|uniref:hydroxyethylthiazole kinase n=1 Tax=Haemophilus influenzae TaxID=727 RepID=UPI00270C2A23|nr:hydroxyethylthiazole kinase [Haemophilus influenzae]MDO7259687.1 hydroxyethylthiazole kinase [Haemophilus influenzae]
MQSIYLSKIREQNPLIHNITNIVAANFSANGLLALGASPLMSANVEEMQEVPKISQALVINIGTLIGKDREAMLQAGKTANEVGIPVVLDPVGVGATSYRRETISQLLAEVKFALIRGNAGELAAIAGEAWQAKGVDAGQGEVDLKAVAEKVAQRYGCTVLISGAVDIVSDGTQTATVHNGTSLFPKVTASGCLLSAVCAAFLAVSEGNYFSATLEACVAYTIAGECAAQGLTTQVGQFQIRLLDELAALSPETIGQRGRINE